MWILVVMAFMHGGLYGTSPAVAVNSIPGFQSEEGCKTEGQKLMVGNNSRTILTFCLNREK